jgi:hypothetical protein
MNNVIVLRASVANHAALANILLALVRRACVRGEMDAATAERTLVTACARDCGVLRATVETLLTRSERCASVPLVETRSTTP